MFELLTVVLLSCILSSEDYILCYMTLLNFTLIFQAYIKLQTWFWQKTMAPHIQSFHDHEAESASKPL